MVKALVRIVAFTAQGAMFAHLGASVSQFMVGFAIVIATFLAGEVE